MITCYLQGGLGNQLFIIITTIAYGLRHNQPVLFDYSDKLTGGCTLRYTFWDTFLFALKPLTTTMSIPRGKVIRENTGGYRPIEPPLGENRVLTGYFQSYKYFDHQYCRIFVL